MSIFSIYLRWLIGVMALAGSVFLQPLYAQKTFDVSVLAGSCANCHGASGRSNTAIPSLAAQPEALLRQQLLAFKSATPPAHTTVMDRLVKALSDEELGALAHYFSQIPAQGVATP